MAPLRETRFDLLMATGHFLSQFLDALPAPVVSCPSPAALHAHHPAPGLPAPIGLPAGHYRARRFLIGGKSLMTHTMAVMGAATAYWQILVVIFPSGGPSGRDLPRTAIRARGPQGAR